MVEMEQMVVEIYSSMEELVTSKEEEVICSMEEVEICKYRE